MIKTKIDKKFVEDITGNKYGLLTAISPHDSYSFWVFKCDCGNEKIIRKGNVKNGGIQSCGCVNRRKFKKLNKLLDESYESFYWLGFLFADGHFSETRLTVSQSEKDKDQIYKFQKFIGDGKISVRKVTTGFTKTTEYRYSAMDVDTVKTLRDRYSIVNNKTVLPPNLSSLTEEQLLCVMIGFTDGDGNIKNQSGRKDCILQVKCHSSWLNNLELLYNRKFLINREGYAYGTISDNEVLRKWKSFAVENCLPYNTRKWGLINEHAESRYVNASRIKENTLYLNSTGLKNSDIARQLDISDSYVTQILKELKNEL